VAEVKLKIARDGVQLKRSAYGVASHDPYLAAAGARAKAAAQELEALGITDSHGNRFKTDLPEDMGEEADRDFGGSVLGGVFSIHPEAKN
jgi:hypothetical protein